MCFFQNSFPASNAGFPDTCLTETGSGSAPVAYSNSAQEAAGTPAPYNILTGGSPVHNMSTILPPSQGDLPGHSGVGSGTVLGPASDFSFLTTTTLMGSMPTKRMGSSGTSNFTNSPTAAVSPNQLKVVGLSS